MNRITCARQVQYSSVYSRIDLKGILGVRIKLKKVTTKIKVVVFLKPSKNIYIHMHAIVPWVTHNFRGN